MLWYDVSQRDAFVMNLYVQVIKPGRCQFMRMHIQVCQQIVGAPFLVHLKCSLLSTCAVSMHTYAPGMHPNEQSECCSVVDLLHPDSRSVPV